MFKSSLVIFLSHYITASDTLTTPGFVPLMSGGEMKVYRYYTVAKIKQEAD